MVALGPAAQPVGATGHCASARGRRRWRVGERGGALPAARRAGSETRPPTASWCCRHLRARIVLRGETRRHTRQGHPHGADGCRPGVGVASGRWADTRVRAQAPKPPHTSTPGGGGRPPQGGGEGELARRRCAHIYLTVSSHRKDNEERRRGGFISSRKKATKKLKEKIAARPILQRRQPGQSCMRAACTRVGTGQATHPRQTDETTTSKKHKGPPPQKSAPAVGWVGPHARVHRALAVKPRPPPSRSLPPRPRCGETRNARRPTSSAPSTESTPQRARKPG